MYTKNIIIFTIAVAVMCVCVDALAVKRRVQKTKVRKSKRPITIPAVIPPTYGCQPPVLEIVNCGCRGPLEPLPLCGCPKRVIDISNYYDADMSGTTYYTPVETANFAYAPTYVAVPNPEYIPTVELPCGCTAAPCGCPGPCRPQVPPMRPVYPYGSFTAIEIPAMRRQEWQGPGYPVYTEQVTPQFAQMGCGCRAPNVVPTTLPCGCPVVPYQQVYTCGQQVTMPCGCQGLICGCTSPNCDFQVQVEVPACGCGVQGCGCPPPVCGVPGCMCGGSYLRQVTLQPPFL